MGEGDQPVKLRRFVRAAAVAFVLAEPVCGNALAQAAPDSACLDLFPTYEAWMATPWRYGNAPWPHDRPVEETSPIWAAYWARRGVVVESHPTNLSIWGPSTSQGCWDYVSRWLDEARAYGDIVIPISPYRGRPEPVYFVLHAGTPPETAIRVMELYFGISFHVLPPGELEGAVAAYRATLGP